MTSVLELVDVDNNNYNGSGVSIVMINLTSWGKINTFDIVVIAYIYFVNLVWFTGFIPCNSLTADYFSETLNFVCKLLFVKLLPHKFRKPAPRV